MEQPAVVEAAIATFASAENNGAASGGADIPSVWQCDECAYVAKSFKALRCHRSTFHGVLDSTNWCIDTSTCTVCLLAFSSVAACKAHVMDKSRVCRLNLLMRGPFLSTVEVLACNVGVSSTRCTNLSAGKPRNHAKFLATRTFGPIEPVYNVAGEPFVPYKGNPLRVGPLRLPHRLIECDVQPALAEGQCPASVRKPCAVGCLLCRGTAHV